MTMPEGSDTLSRIWPEFSAHRTLSRGQQLGFSALAILILAASVFRPSLVLSALVALSTGLYLGTLLHRVLLLRVALRLPAAIHIGDDEALALAPTSLPVYTILVPAYQEGELIVETVAALELLDYPKELLDLKILLEVDDTETIKAAQAIVSGLNPDLVLVHPGGPRTKPKACNVGLRRATGEFVTIYDAEDRPEPLQLRRAVAAFRKAGPRLACLQARLSYHNVHQNMLTRWFTVEYETWFSLMLPALARVGGPVPLGGTSMHIPRATLEHVCAWDPFNVTEDADLGVRLQRLGYTISVLDSTTLEEANSDVVNWVRQRSRWYKGYLQTWLVHMRNPVRLWHDVGGRAFVGINLLLGAVPFVAMVNPLFWILTIVWFLVQPPGLAALLPPIIYYPSLVSLIVGNFIALYISVIAIRVTDRADLLPAVVVSPCYWVLMSIAAIRAFIQLIVAPTFWEKSVHGLGPLPIDQVVSESAIR